MENYTVWFYLYINYLESKRTTTTTTATSLLSPPKYTNPELEKMIKENKDGSHLWLDEYRFTDDDMQIVAYYALQYNKVSNIVFIFYC